MIHTIFYTHDILSACNIGKYLYQIGSKNKLIQFWLTTCLASKMIRSISFLNENLEQAKPIGWFYQNACIVWQTENHILSQYWLSTFTHMLRLTVCFFQGLPKASTFSMVGAHNPHYWCFSKNFIFDFWKDEKNNLIFLQLDKSKEKICLHLSWFFSLLSPFSIPTISKYSTEYFSYCQ